METCIIECPKGHGNLAHVNYDKHLVKRFEKLREADPSLDILKTGVTACPICNAIHNFPCYAIHFEKFVQIYSPEHNIYCVAILDPNVPINVIRIFAERIGAVHGPEDKRRYLLYFDHLESPRLFSLSEVATTVQGRVLSI